MNPNAGTKKALSVAVFVVAFLGVKYGVQSYRNYQAGANTEKFMNQLQTDAVQKHPDVSASEALAQEVTALAAQKLASEGDAAKRASTAADMFWGFYFINVRARPEFCREQGIDIGRFVEAFETGHVNELAKARSIYARSSVDENTIYAGIKPHLRKSIVQDMNDIAAANKVTVREACQLVADNADTLAAEMHLSKAQPAIFQALSAAR